MSPIRSVWTSAPGVFRVGEQVSLRRGLPSLRADSEGVVRGVSATASGVSYVVRFAKLTRVVAERDLAPPKSEWRPFAAPVGV